MGGYTEYKDSGNIWIGEMPVAWETTKVSRIATTHNGDRGTNYPSGVDFVGDGIPFVNAPSLDGGWVIDELVPRITLERYNLLGGVRLQKDDIIYCLRGNVGKSAVSEYTGGTVASSLMVIRAKETINKHYLFHLINSPIEEQQRIFVTTGAVAANLSAENVAKFVFPLPKRDEQDAIAAYLDLRTAEIDTLLADLTRQAEMLDTYKRELIAETVTKGLDKSAAMKDSGVDWIGEIPDHWEATKTKWMFEIVKRIYGKEDRDVLSITQRGIKVRDIKSNDGQLAESYANYQVVNVNNFAMNSMDLLTGWVDCSPFEGVTSPDYRVFRFLPGKAQCHNYYKYLFQMCYKNRIFYRLGQGVSNLGRWRLQSDQFLNMRLPQPPVAEQERIAAYLDEKIAKIEGLITDITTQIEKLKQYRQIIIHDAVTGKVKVTEG